MKTLSVALLFLVLSACKSLDSSLSHEWDRTLLPGGKLDCKEEEITGPEASYRSYIREQLEILAKANPKTFSDELAPSKFCIVPIVYEDIDAGASIDGSLFINTGVLRATETDAQFAAVLAHELAHITLRHGATELKDFVQSHPQYQTEFAELESQEKAITRFDKLKIVPEGEWTAYLDSLRSQVRKKWNAARAKGSPVAMKGLECESINTWIKDEPLRAAIRPKLPASDYEASLCLQFFAEFYSEDQQATRLALWKEIEADEVGFEFFLRAGFPEDEYAQFFSNVARLEGGERDCRRGNKDHPSDCWRAENIRAELKAHAKDIPHTVKTHDFGEQLSKLRAEWPTPRVEN